MHPPFHAERYDIGRSSTDARVSLEPIPDGGAAALARAMTAIDPWARLGTDPGALTAYLTGEDAHCCRKVIRVAGADAGVVAVRSPWLHGPYLTLLAVLPPHPAAGIGARVIEWMAGEVRVSAKNIWVCTSSFNDRAQAFYRRHGFTPVGDIDDLVAPGFSEILLRKRL